MFFSKNCRCKRRRSTPLAAASVGNVQERRAEQMQQEGARYATFLRLSTEPDMQRSAASRPLQRHPRLPKPSSERLRRPSARGGGGRGSDRGLFGANHADGREIFIDSIAVSVFADIFIELTNTEMAATTLWALEWMWEIIQKWSWDWTEDLAKNRAGFVKNSTGFLAIIQLVFATANLDWTRFLRYTLQK